MTDMTENITNENITDAAAEVAKETKGKGKKAKRVPFEWRAEMAKAGAEKDTEAKYGKRAGERLWKAFKAGAAEWLGGKAEEDESGEGIYGEFLAAYGEKRKGDASKMKTVAMAMRDHGLDAGEFPNLSRAYAEATRLTKTMKVEADEDTAAEAATERIAEAAPKSATSGEGAALILLSKGVDEAARLLIDAIGGEDTQAQRSLLRALSSEIAGRAKPAPKVAEKSEDKAKDGTAKAPAKGAKAAPAKPAAEKPKAAPAKAAPAKAAPAKAAPAKAAPAKAAPAKAAPVVVKPVAKK